MPPVILLDACTLYPAALRDILMRLALHRLIQARWTDAIHDEWINSVLRSRADLTRERLLRTRELKDLHARESLVTGYQKHIPRLNLPDPDDRHVLAAAIEAGAETLLTWNLKDFPVDALAAYKLKAESPDALLVRLLASHRDRFLCALREARTCLKYPPLTAPDYLKTLRAQGLVDTCGLLEKELAEL